MYRKCTTEISARHQRQAEESLLNLMQKIPYEDITVTQLCAEAGITRRVFYHLFSNKNDALCALIDHIILDQESYQSGQSDEALGFFQYWKKQAPLLDALSENQMTGLLLERMVTCVMDEDYDYRHWLRANGWDREVEQETVIFNLSGIMGLIFSWYYSHFRKSPEEMARIMTRLLTQPLARTNTHN